MANGAELKLHQRLFAQPIGRLHRREHAQRADARLAAVGKREEQQFELEFVAVRRFADQAGHRAGLLLRQRREQGIDPAAAFLAPEIGKAPAFHLAAEQRANARAGEPEAQRADEIGGQHEGVGERLPDCGGVDIAALGRCTIAPRSFQCRSTRWEERCFIAPPVSLRGGWRCFYVLDRDAQRRF